MTKHGPAASGSSRSWSGLIDHAAASPSRSNASSTAPVNRETTWSRVTAGASLVVVMVRTYERKPTGAGSGIGQIGIDLFGRGRQARQVKRDAPHQRKAIRLGNVGPGQLLGEVSVLSGELPAPLAADRLLAAYDGDAT